VTTILARVTHDHLTPTSEVGRAFEYPAFVDYWARQNFGGFELSPNYLDDLTSRRFRLYDDDGELYYSGWLLDDDGELLVQQWVLAWGMAYAGCTTIKVFKNGKWVQEIG